MITRRSINRTANSVKPLTDYLNEQDALLDNVSKVLSREYQAIKNRQVDALEAIAEEKSSLMLQLQANDQRLKLHPETARLRTDYLDRVKAVKDKLAKCKMMNETNGKLIALSMAANRRLSAVLMSARDRFSRNMTYDDKGNTVARGPMRVNTNA